MLDGVAGWALGHAEADQVWGDDVVLSGQLRAELHALTLIEHQSLVKLPAPGFVPCLADPRTGTVSEPVAEYGAPPDTPVTYRLATCFRLEKTDPTAARSPVRNPREGLRRTSQQEGGQREAARNCIFMGHLRRMT